MLDLAATSRKVLAIIAVSSLAACSAESAEPAPASQDADFTAREGYAKVENARGGVYVSVAVSGKRAFLGDNRSAIDIVDLSKMKKTGTIEGRIPSEALSVAGDVLAACGDRDDQPLGWDALYGASDRNYIITLLDAKTGEKKREISLRLQRYLESGARGGFIDLPSMSCQLSADAKRISVSFSQAHLEDEIVTFDLPSEPVSYDFRDIPGATRVSVGTSRDNTIKGFSQSDRGLTYAAGGWGLRRLAPGASAYATLRDEGREHYVGVVEQGEHLFAADHDGALRVLDAESGAAVDALEVDDWVEGVTLSGGLVVVVAREGLFVARDRWTR
jgi:hypothetical protein